MNKILISFLLLIPVAIGVYKLNRSTTFQLFGEIHARIDTHQKVVALTLDDGPNEKLDTVLSILKSQQVKATFFPIGNLMEKRLMDITKIVNDGHELGNHSYTHRKLSFKTYNTIREEIEPTDQLIRKAGYTGAIHFRPPYGMKLFMLPLYLQQSNRKTITWDVCPEGNPDINSNPDKMAAFVIDKTKNGSIILLHPTNDGYESSLKALEPIILGLKKKGFAFLTVSQLLALQN